MKYLTNILTIFFILFIAHPLFANTNDISVMARTDKTKVYMDSNVILTVTVTGSKAKDADLRLPKFTGFRFYSRGVSKSISIINGEMSVSSIYTYILTPKSPGKFEIDPVVVSYEGKSYQSEAIPIQVMPGTAPAPAAGPSYDSRAPSAKARQEHMEQLDQTDGRYFVEMEVDKQECYVNEQITMKFKFYRSANLLSDPVYEPPTLNGFWKEDLKSQSTSYEIIDGVRYAVTTVDTALFPIKSGQLQISSAVLKCVVPSTTGRTRRRRFDDIFDRFFGSDGFGVSSRGERRTLKTKSINIDVLALPEKNMPDNFSGAVGEFDIRASLDKKHVSQGDALNLTIEFEGEGNINSLKLPTLPELENFDVYSPDKTDSKIYPKGNRIRGKTSYEIVLIPKKSGMQTIPSIKFNYFDPYWGEYKEISTRPISVEVKPSSKRPVDEKQPVVYDYTKQEPIKEDIAFLKEDIRHIKADLRRCYVKGSGVSKMFLFVLLLALPLMIFIQVGLQLNKQRLEKDAHVLQKRNALKNARKALVGVKDYEGLSDVLKTYVADKLGVSAFSITSDEIEKTLQKNNVSEKDIKIFIELLNAADLARFAVGMKKKEFSVKDVKLAKDIVNRINKWS